jgi:alpha-glucosidase
MTALCATRTQAARTPQHWWQRLVLYECQLPSFRDGDGDGMGDLQGITDALPYLDETLGVDAIWTGPFYRSPLLDQGFDVADHRTVEPRFGDLATLDRLLREAHARGMRVITDFIPNHTSDQHPWFQASRASRSDTKREWYVWAHGRDGGPPNNWISESGGSSWERDDRTGQFYLHSHLPQQPDLNWRHPRLRAEMLDVLRFWLDRGVDGFRIDVAHMLMKDPELRDNPPSPDASPNEWDIQHADFTTQLHVNDRMHPDLHAVLREIRAVVDAYDGDRVTIGEIEAMAWEDWARYFGEAGDELHLPFAFKLIETPWTPAALRATIQELEAALASDAWPIFALGNHDRPRLATRLGLAQARVAAMLLLTLRGTPCLFYGDELGLRDQPVPSERQRDHFGLAAGGASRDPIRTPMPWHGGRNGGFSTARERDLWLPVWRDHRHDNVEAQLADPASMLSLYRRLIALRGASPALHTGDYATHRATDERCLVFAREADDDRRLVALNLTDVPHRVQLGTEGTIALSTALDREGEHVAGALELRADEGVVVEVQHIRRR